MLPIRLCGFILLSLKYVHIYTVHCTRIYTAHHARCASFYLTLTETSRAPCLQQAYGVCLIPRNVRYTCVHDVRQGMSIHRQVVDVLGDCATSITHTSNHSSLPLLLPFCVDVAPFWLQLNINFYFLPYLTALLTCCHSDTTSSLLTIPFHHSFYPPFHSLTSTPPTTTNQPPSIQYHLSVPTPPCLKKSWQAATPWVVPSLLAQRPPLILGPHPYPP